MVQNNLFAYRLKDLREKKGFSQAAFADAVGCARSSMGLYEKGDRRPDVEVFANMCDVLGCLPDYLLGLSDNEEHKNQLVGKHLGLSDYSIEILQDGVVRGGLSQISNKIIGSVDFLDILDRIFSIIQADKQQQNAEELNAGWTTDELKDYRQCESFLHSKGFAISTPKQIADAKVEEAVNLFREIIRRIREEA